MGSYICRLCNLNINFTHKCSGLAKPLYYWVIGTSVVHNSSSRCKHYTSRRQKPHLAGPPTVCLVYIQLHERRRVVQTNDPALHFRPAACCPPVTAPRCTLHAYSWSRLRIWPINVTKQTGLGRCYVTGADQYTPCGEGLLLSEYESTDYN